VFFGFFQFCILAVSQLFQVMGLIGTEREVIGRAVFAQELLARFDKPGRSLTAVQRAEFGLPTLTQTRREANQ
jgi:hypothetical protein